MSDKSKTTTRQDNSLDPWTKYQFNKSTGNVRSILSDNPFEAYSGQRVADMNDTQTAARESLISGRGVSEGLFADAAAAAGEAGGFTPSTINPSLFSEADLSAYQNPYEDQVVQTALADIERQRQIANNDTRGRLLSSGAFGGSRHGVAEAETNRAAIDASARTSAQLRSAGFNTAADLFTRDADRSFAADSANNEAGFAAAGLDLQAGGLLGQLGQLSADENRSYAGMLRDFGDQEQRLEQLGLDANYAEFLRGEEDPYRRAQMELAILSGTPVVTDGVSTSSTSGSPGLLSIAGTGLSLAGSLGWKPFA